MAADNSIFNPCFSEWYKRVLSTAVPYYRSFLNEVVNKSRFGIDVKANHKVHKQFTRVMGLLVLLYWRAWEHNTWYAEEDEEGCLQYLPLGSFIEDKTIACLVKEMDCIGLDVRPLLRIAGVRPLPDGIGVMQIEANTDCNSILFQVDKPRRDDIPPQTNILL